MKRIILDHLKRWGWLWLVIGVANCFMTGSFIDHERNFGALTFQLVLWLGAMQLNFDLQRGVGRALTTLPVTARQIGRAWWIFSVALPALLLAATSGFAMLLHSSIATRAFPMKDFVVVATANTLFLGALFYLFVGSIPRWPHSMFGWLRHILSIGVLMGIIFIQPALDAPKGIALLLVAAVLTVAGWFHCEQMVLLRAGFRPGIQLGKRQPGVHKAPAGFGGLPFLWGTLFIRVGRFALLFVGLLLLMQVLMRGGLKLTPKQSFEAALPAISSFGYFFTYVFLLLPTVMQLRLLRTLPISTTALATLLVLLPVIPIMVAGLVWSVFGGVLSGGGNVFQIPIRFLMYAAMTAIGAPFFVWQGLKFGSYLLIMVLIMVSSIGPMIFHTTKIPPTLTALVSLGIMALAFELTRRLLQSSSRAYQTPPTTMTGWGGWGGGR